MRVSSNIKTGGFLFVALFISSCWGKGDARKGQSQVVTQAPPIGAYGQLRPAAGFSPSQYDLFGTTADTPFPIREDGIFQVNVASTSAGIVFASPKPGTPLASHLAFETGIYMTPHLGSGLRIVQTASAQGYMNFKVSAQGNMMMDAHTTLFCVMMMHPMLANPDPTVQQQQVAWMANRFNAGWPELAAAAKGYDAALLARKDPTEDPAFQQNLFAALTRVQSEMPEFKPVYPTAQASGASTAAALRPTRPAPNPRLATIMLWPWSDSDEKPKIGVLVIPALKEVGYIESTPIDENNAELNPKTVLGTALDYYFTVAEVDVRALRPDDHRLKKPSVVDQLPLLKQVADGVVSARSYASYLDVANKLADIASRALGRATGLISGVKVSKPNVYEVRMFSGGFSNFNNPLQYEHIKANFALEAQTAFRQNVAMAVVEVLTSFPGYNEILGEGTGQAVIKGAIESAFMQIESMAARKSLTANDLKDVILNSAKGAMDAAMAEWTKDQAKGAIKAGWGRVARYLGSGAKKLFKLVLKFPSQVAKGGSLVNRCARLAAPYSLMEYFVVRVGVSPCEQFVGENLDEGEDIEEARQCIDCLDKNCEDECLAMVTAGTFKAFGDCEEGCREAQKACIDKCKGGGAGAGPFEQCMAGCGGINHSKKDAAKKKACMNRCMTDPNMTTGFEGCIDNCTPALNACNADCQKRYPEAVKAEDEMQECGERACPAVCGDD